MQTFAVTSFTEIITEWICPQKSDEGIQLPNPILKRGTRETPFVFRFKGEGGFGGVGGSFFDIVSLV